MAFSVLMVGFCVYGGMVKFRGGVAHYLTRRYMPDEESLKIQGNNLGVQR